MAYLPKTILITGASSGLGASLAQAYAKPGITLFLIARDQERLSQIAFNCEIQGAKTYTKIIDVRNKESMSEWLSTLSLDLVIANAGISAGSENGMESLEQIEQVFDTNLHGVLNTILPVIPQCIKNNHGQIAIISSLAGYRGLPNCPSYSASKAAVKVYGEALRGLLAVHNIGITVITPGYIKTPLTSKNKFPMPFIITADKAAAIIKEKLKYNPSLIAFPYLFYLIVRCISLLPAGIIDSILTKLPAKQAIKSHNFE
ncbi:NADP-dependent 3-hydroxy acid dehydrogenase YdfG [Rickettsiales bacterium Ac37b]|nr:NADP-dependent 3-hydroxy acid dehydrogenase YdfG [Rickettsiales bacterium Ac37b]